MSILDGVMGGIVGAGVTHLVSGFIEQHGGLQAVISQFERQGLGATVKSWVGTGANLPISADQVHAVLGSEMMQKLAAKTGLPVADLAQKLAEVLPQTIDKMTPAGVVPPARAT